MQQHRLDISTTPPRYQLLYIIGTGSVKPQSGGDLYNIILMSSEAAK
jgi:hypothetical protein